MKKYRIEEMVGGWFVGKFKKRAYKTKFEVAYKTHKAGEKWDRHFHKKSVEINLLIRGSMVIQDQILSAGDIFVIKPYEISDPVFLEDCELIIVKTKSIPGDKYIV